MFPYYNETNSPDMKAWDWSRILSRYDKCVWGHYHLAGHEDNKHVLSPETSEPCVWSPRIHQDVNL